MLDSLLALLQPMAPVDSTYLTRMDSVDGVQRVVAVIDSGDPIVSTGQAFDLEQSICARALATGETCVSDAQARWPDAGVARQLGVKGYMATPV